MNSQDKMKKQLQANFFQRIIIRKFHLVRARKFKNVMFKFERISISSNPPELEGVNENSSSCREKWKNEIFQNTKRGCPRP